MTTYFEAPDGHGEPALWDKDQPADFPLPALSKRNVTDYYWPDVVARMTGTTITNDDASVERIRDVIVEATGLRASSALNAATAIIGMLRMAGDNNA